MKILVASSKYYPEYSGSGLRAHNTYIRLQRKYDVQFDLLVNSISYQGNTKYQYDGIDITRISLPFKIPSKKSFLRFTLLSLSFFWEIFYSWKFIKNKINDYDLLHTFGNTWTIGFLSWYFSKKNKPIIRELCNDMNNPLYPIQFQKLIRSVFKKKNTLVVAISKKLEHLAKKFYITNIWFRPNPVDESKFFVNYKKKNILRHSLSKFKENDIVLCLVANFIDRKNQLFAIDVLNLLPNNFKLILAGPLKDENITYFNQIQKKIKKLNIHHRINIKIGFIKNINEYIQCSDIFLFPSKAEGLGTPLLESQACGVPVVSNYIKDITDDVIKEKKGGYYLELNEKRWSKIIPKVLQISKDDLTENARCIHNKCSSKIIDDEYFKKINRLIDKKT